MRLYKYKKNVPKKIIFSPNDRNTILTLIDHTFVIKVDFWTENTIAGSKLAATKPHFNMSNSYVLLEIGINVNL